jgi:hypothetical protein
LPVPGKVEACWASLKPFPAATLRGAKLRPDLRFLALNITPMSEIFDKVLLELEAEKAKLKKEEDFCKDRGLCDTAAIFRSQGDGIRKAIQRIENLREKEDAHAG